MYILKGTTINPLGQNPLFWKMSPESEGCSGTCTLTSCPDWASVITCRPFPTGKQRVRVDESHPTL